MQPSAHSAISMSVHDVGLNNAYRLAGDEQRSTDGNGGSPGISPLRESRSRTLVGGMTAVNRESEDCVFVYFLVVYASTRSWSH